MGIATAINFLKIIGTQKCSFFIVNRRKRKVFKIVITSNFYNYPQKLSLFKKKAVIKILQISRKTLKRQLF